MTDRPILFSAPMIRALLAGRKSQTRRLDQEAKGNLRPGEIITRRPADAFVGQSRAFRPKHRVGDRLWVREAWRTEARYDALAPSKLPRSAAIYYAADPNPRDSEPGCAGRLRASMHMPRWASRLTLIVTDVRIERLNDISEEDAIAEGIEPIDDFGQRFWTRYRDGGWNAYVDEAIPLSRWNLTRTQPPSNPHRRLKGQFHDQP